MASIGSNIIIGYIDDKTTGKEIVDEIAACGKPAVATSCEIFLTNSMVSTKRRLLECLLSLARHWIVLRRDGFASRTR